MANNPTNTTMIDIALLELNEGQLRGVPTNPRRITDERMEALKKSVSELPDMLALRELLVYPHGEKYVVLCGNMRLEACKALGWEQVPCKVIPASTSEATLRRIVMIDNEEFGQTDWDIIKNSWNADELKNWGIEVLHSLTSEYINSDLGSFFDENNEDGDNASEENESEEEAYVLNLIFEDSEKLNDFLDKYKERFTEEFNCLISVSGGKL